jgi:hypothetical protein
MRLATQRRALKSLPKSRRCIQSSTLKRTIVKRAKTTPQKNGLRQPSEKVLFPHRRFSHIQTARQKPETNFPVFNSDNSLPIKEAADFAWPPAEISKLGSKTFPPMVPAPGEMMLVIGNSAATPSSFARCLAYSTSPCVTADKATLGSNKWKILLAGYSGESDDIVHVDLEEDIVVGDLELEEGVYNLMAEGQGYDVIIGEQD